MQPEPPPPVDLFFGNRLSGLLGCALGTPLPWADPGAWEPPDVEHVARLLPQHEIEALIGRGGMGAVYKGRRKRLNRIEAIKILPPELASNADFVARFEREAQTLASLNHPGIVTIYDFGQTAEGHSYIVMEYVDGTDLHRIIQGPKLDVTQALRLTVQICEALQYAHDHDVIHRDIKPANVLVTPDGRAKLADFGLALKSLEAAQAGAFAAGLGEVFDSSDPLGRLTRPGTALGTPDYAAPEMYAGESDRRSDIYALGIMLYEMLTGLPPKGYFALPSTTASVDKRIDDVVVKALEVDPAARYQSATEMKLDVEQATIPLPAASLPPAIPQPRRLMLKVILGVGLVLAGLGTARVLTQGGAAPTKKEPSKAVVVAAASAPSTTPSPAPVESWTTEDQRAFEQTLRAYTWRIPSRGWVVEFGDKHRARVQEGKVVPTWHWWITGPRTLHVQFAAMPAQFDPGIGATYVFDKAMTKFDSGLRLSEGIRGKLVGEK